MENPCIYFVGTAGAGKTTLTHAFQLWLQGQGHDSITVNLDPGVTSLPYAPDVDIREWIRLNAVMEEYGLGPNGAQIVAADLLTVQIQKVRLVLDSFRTNYTLVDTPGQIELFAFRRSSNLIVDALSDQAMIVFCFDPMLSSSPGGLISELLLSAIVQFRLGAPTLNVLTKVDLLEEKALESVLKWASDHESLYAAALDERPTPQTQANLEFFRAIQQIGALQTLIPVSSSEMRGLDDIYTAAQELWMGGEDLDRA